MSEPYSYVEPKILDDSIFQTRKCLVPDPETALYPGINPVVIGIQQLRFTGNETEPCREGYFLFPV